MTVNDRNTWIPWNKTSVASGSRRGSNMRDGIYYYSRPSQCIGVGCNSPGLEHDGMPLTCYSTVDLEPDLRTLLANHWDDIRHAELYTVPRHRKDARIAYKAIVPFPTELTVGQIITAMDNMLETTFHGQHEYFYAVHKGEPTERGFQQLHVHLVVRARPLSGLKKDALWLTGHKEALKAHYGYTDDQIAKMKQGNGKKGGAWNGKKNGIVQNVFGAALESAQGEELSKLGYKILPHGARRGGEMRRRRPGVVMGREKRVRKAQRENERLSKEYRHLIDEDKRLEQELSDLELEKGRQQGKARAPAGPSKQQTRAPQVPRQGIDFDRLDKGMNSLKDQVQADRAKQKESRRERTEAPQHEHDRTERDGIDI
ncbi:MAG: hypothetical protein A4E60_01944 [Syntrophorhabdus sp. PtaB.Bin047]|nr:MAG: hypothetical protein A4E60_01944 [Syntrophorhabdus sp. PtaB.Bin047]